MSTGSTRLIETYGGSAHGKATAVSLGYDRVRFIAPVFIGDTITVRYQITRIEPGRDRSYGAVVVTNQHGSQVAVADNILKWVPIELMEGAESHKPPIRDRPKFLDESEEGGDTRSQNHKENHEASIPCIDSNSHDQAALCRRLSDHVGPATSCRPKPEDYRHRRQSCRRPMVGRLQEGLKEFNKLTRIYTFSCRVSRNPMVHCKLSSLRT
jgi:hypothetical protein